MTREVAHLHAARRRAVAGPAGRGRWTSSLSRTVLALSAALLTAVGCRGETRDPVEVDTLLGRRSAADEQAVADARGLSARMIARTKRLRDDFDAGRRPAEPVIDVLVLSGGGDWGAFAAGLLKGWSRVPEGDPMAMPEFDIVTGVSTGALIAPFAFLGDDASLDSVATLYRNPQPDWARKRGWFYFLPHHPSLSEVPGLERDLEKHVTPDMVRRLAEAGADGRVLAINTTNLDDGGPRVFDLAVEASRAAGTGKLDRIYDIMLASSGIPGAFPFRVIDGEMLVDGAVTGNIIYGGRISEADGLSATWARQYPGVRAPKVRYWVLFNNQFRPQPSVTEPRWPAVLVRSLEASTRASTITAMRHLFAMAEIARLKHGADVEVRVASIPSDWKPPEPGVFVKETMNDLADLGERMGADPSSWRDAPP